MTNFQRSRKDKGGKFKIIIITLIILFLILNYFKLTSFHTFGFFVSGPVLKTKEVILSPFNNFFAYFKSKQELEEKNKELEKEISNLKIEVLSSEILRFEYQSILKETENSKQETEQSVEIAKVILKPPFSSFDNLVLGGQFDQSDLNQKVFYRNIFIGEIVEITNKTAIVKLASASKNISPVKLSDGNLFEAIGKGYGQYEITLPKDVEVKVGDPVAYPENEIVLFGVVNKVVTSEDDLFNKVLFNIPIDFAEINYVRIGTPLDVLE